ncbi:DUF202 domain-containing protein [Leclercia adecarboxylata]|uniref:DUF202 domain-containing protein n=1 Tax=Leclercia adecarboxylata TaxID=83655 RepID=UPI0033064F05
MTGEHLDKGLQYERTILSWRRTFFSCIVMVSYFAKTASTDIYFYMPIGVALLLIIVGVCNDVSQHDNIATAHYYWRFNLMLLFILSLSAVIFLRLFHALIYQV